MTIQKQDLKAIAAQLLSGMLANPHIYTAVSDGEAKGQQERILISNAVMMAETLLEKVEQSRTCTGRMMLASRSFGRHIRFAWAGRVASNCTIPRDAGLNQPIPSQVFLGILADLIKPSSGRHWDHRRRWYQRD